MNTHTHTHSYRIQEASTDFLVSWVVLTCTGHQESLRCWIEFSQSWEQQTTKYCFSVRWPHSWQSWRTTLLTAASSICVWMVRIQVFMVAVFFFFFSPWRSTTWFSSLFTLSTCQVLPRLRIEGCYWRRSMTQSRSTLFSSWAQGLEASASTCSLLTLWLFLILIGTHIK